jgi:hypothetical protein
MRRRMERKNNKKTTTYISGMCDFAFEAPNLLFALFKFATHKEQSGKEEIVV